MFGGVQQRPVVVIRGGDLKRESGKKAQKTNIIAAKAVADIIRSTLGPRAMLKMILDQMGTVQLTSDGNAILREVDVSHPAAKSMIELSRTQDEEVGDGTTSVIVLAGEILTVAEPYLDQQIHPTRIVKGFFMALEDAIHILHEKLSIPVDLNNKAAVLELVQSCIGTKFTHRHSDLMCGLAIDAVSTIQRDVDGKKEIDIKRYARVEKIPGGNFAESRVISGVVLNKDILHNKMRRRIENPRILLLDCNIEYKKGESKTDVDLSEESHFQRLLEIEEEYIKEVTSDIIKFKPDLVVTEKGVSDLAIFYFVKAGISVLRRARKTDNNRIARATGATIVNRTSEIKESDIGTGAGLFEVRKIGDEYFSFIEQCKDPKACSILLRGPSKDILNEIERNLQDAMHVVRNIYLDPRIVPGGGAVEMALSQALLEKSKTIKGVEQYPYQAVAHALEAVPRQLATNCGAKTIRVITELRAKHAKGQNPTWGIDGLKGVLVDMNELKIWEPVTVKSQTLKTAVEASCMLLRIDDVLSGLKRKGDAGGAGEQGNAPPMDEAEGMME
ncbi:T-complex protein 1 subunit gamma [Acrasis kona]|uniref:T-complex protein 1 subunit gamma n=1 Tax=Acrasis kona TaxID=1008807 RepID=A0AAW2ZB37_9EUKA